MAVPENTIADPTKVQTATTYAAPATAPTPAIAPTAPKTATAAPSTTATTTKPPSTMAPKPAATAPAFVKPQAPTNPLNVAKPTIAPAVAVARPTIAPAVAVARPTITPAVAVARPTITPAVAVARPTIAQPIAPPSTGAPGILTTPAVAMPQDPRAQMEQANLDAQNAAIMFNANEENRARVLAAQQAAAQARPAPTIGSPVQTIFPGPAPRTIEQVNPQGRGRFDNPNFVHPTQPDFIRPAQPNGPPLSRIPNSGPGRAPVVAPAPAPAIPMTTLPAVANANRGRGRALGQINQIRAQQGRAPLALAPGHSAKAKAINAAQMVQARAEAGLPPGPSPRFGATMIKAPRRRGGR